MVAMTSPVSEIFDPAAWTEVAGFDFTDITYHRANDVGAVRIAFDRPEIRNAFRPNTVDELYAALDHARMSSDIGCVLLTGNGPSPRDGGWAFCSGGDQRIRGKDGYKYAGGETADTIDPGRAGRLHILECQRLIRFMPKVVIWWCPVGPQAVGTVCTSCATSRSPAPSTPGSSRPTPTSPVSTAVSDRPTWRGSSARSSLARSSSSAASTRRSRCTRWVASTPSCRTPSSKPPHSSGPSEICGKSPTAQRMLKYAFNMIDDGLVGQQIFAGEATRLAYASDEAAEGRDAFLEKRPPDWSGFPYFY